MKLTIEITKDQHDAWLLAGARQAIGCQALLLTECESKGYPAYAYKLECELDEPKEAKEGEPEKI